MAKYRIDSTNQTADGSGNLEWHMTALDNDGTVLQDMTTVILTPADEVETALADPNPAGALLALLGANAPEEWLPAALDARVAANAAALGAKEDLNQLIKSYPHEFDV